MSKILIVTEHVYPEEFLLNDLILELRNKNTEIDILTQVPSYPKSVIFEGYKNRFLSKEKWNGCTIYRIFTVLGYNHSIFMKILNYLSFAFFSSLVALFIGNKYEKIFFYQVGPLTMASSSVVFKSIYKKKCFIWIQDVWPDTVFAYGFKKGRLREFLLDKYVKYIYSNFQELLISSEGFYESVRKYTELKITYLPQWFSGNTEKKVENPYSDFGNKKIITFAGNLGKVQNLERIINSLEHIDRDDFVFNIIGEGSYYQKLIRLVEKKQIKNINFVGRVPFDSIYKWLYHSYYLLISLENKPIFNMTIPAKFQAYLKADKPILAVMNGEISKKIIKNKIGLTANPDSMDSIQKSFIRVLEQSPEEYDIFVKNIKSLSDKEYNREKLIRKMKTLIC